ncbi:MAG: glycosyltransferase [Desulfovibrionaceae bacterium]|nr:glycosyltransferase [Desulfovibrionaceae bacterium]
MKTIPYFVLLKVTDLNNALKFKEYLREYLPEAEILALSPKCYCEDLKSTSLAVVSLNSFSWEKAVNEVALNLYKSHPKANLFLWDSSIWPNPGCFSSLIESLKQNAWAAVNPVILRKDFADPHKNRVLNMGLIVDSGGYLHALYEGIAEDDPLISKIRTFQLGTTKALLLRLEDFVSLGGFSKSLDSSLAEFDLTLRLKAKYKNGVIGVDPNARACIDEYMEILELVGVWNSHQQRGRLPPNLVEPDYHQKLKSDGLAYHVDAWLNEGYEPRFKALSKEDAWSLFRLSPDPKNLLAYLGYCRSEEAQKIKILCQSYPCYLPRTYAWYLSQAKLKLTWAKRHELSPLALDLVKWLDQAPSFKEQILKPGMLKLQEAGFYDQSLEVNSSSYDFWQEIIEPSLSSKDSKLEVGKSWPEIAILMPTYNPNLEYLDAALKSIWAQTYTKWQLCVADDASTQGEVREYLTQVAKTDSRIRLIFRPENGHISQATNSALSLATAPYSCLMDQDDLLAEQALEVTSQKLAAKSKLQYVYTDEDHIDQYGVRRSPVFKPFWALDQFGTGHLSTFSTSFLRKIGGLQQGLEGAQDFDLHLRASYHLQRDAIEHIPGIFYHWRIHPGSTAGSITAKPYVILAQKRTLEAHAKRRGLEGEAYPSLKNRFFRLLLKPKDQLKISVVLLGDTSRVHSSLIKSLQNLAPNLTEVFWLPLASEMVPPRILSAFIKGHLPGVDFKVLPWAERSWATGCNQAADQALGQVLLFLAASLVPKSSCRLEQLAYLTFYKEVSLITGYLWQKDLAWDLGLFPDSDADPFPLGKGFSAEELNKIFLSQMLFNHLCLGAAAQFICAAVPRSVFLEAQGFDEDMGYFSEVDYVLKNEAKGMIALATPWVSFEVSENNKFWLQDEAKTIRFREKWGEVLKTHKLRSPFLHKAKDNAWSLISNEIPK